jgi:hypothetical protein
MKKTTQNLMYLGPTITGVVRHSTVFKNGILPSKTAEYVEKKPLMKKLFFPLDAVPEAMKELNKAQSALSAIYKSVIKSK